MSWVPVGSSGGSGLGGGSLGGGLGGGTRGGSRAAASPEGLPFAGIPPELKDAVEKLVAKEPDHGEPGAVFTHQVTDRRRLTLWSLLRQHKAAVTLAGILVIIETLTLQAGPYLTQVGIDRGILAGNFRVVAWVAGAYFATVLCGMTAERGRIGWTGRLAAWVMNDLRVKVFTHLQRMSLDYYTHEPAGVIMTRMTSDIEVLQQLLQDGLVQFAIQGLTVVVVAAVLFSYNVRLAVITLVLIVPVLTVFSMWFRSASLRGYLRVRDGIARVLADLSENLHGVRIVAAHNRQRHNILHHRNVVGAYRDANNYTAHVTAVYGPGTQMLGILGQAALLGIGGYMVLHHELTVGELTAFVLYLNSLFQPIQQLVTLYNSYQQGQAAITKLRGLLATDPTVAEAPGAYDLPPIEGAVSFDHASFGYDPARPVLREVDLHIRAGETIAFVGPTGAGKSTMAKLVTRFYDPTRGRVLIDGHDLRAVTIKSLRQQLGVVPQEPFLFAGSIRDNIAYARPEATEEELGEAVRLVGLTDLVDRTPQGLDAIVHERGQSLSSGERQLLALARAFLAHPRVLVLDEATSNLDLQTETRVEAALDVLLEGRTAILIAHRLSTAMRADRIVVVDEGEIAEIGSHAELLARGERYAEMYATWILHSQAAA
jgi:ATP-binding cassette subfamily B protein